MAAESIASTADAGYQMYTKSSSDVGVLGGETSRGPLRKGAMSMVTQLNMNVATQAHGMLPTETSSTSSSTSWEPTQYTRDFGTYLSVLVPHANRTHFTVDKLRRDTEDGEPLDSHGGGGGRGGARGPLSRHPEESGSLDAPSVWADEYAEMKR